ncbi:hypothetical protein CON45_23935 [Priestia megaterium]|uniref:hypothetical protein n=1 Tax=Priestia megaterium TaxID=1404 RepID=UPI000BED7C82|nr:hypothetical protein [Priestia megaterium]PEA36579.1 hypothetical protein CON45_23935 [Priestia megaterium]
MAPKISAATSVRGVVAYQDEQDSTVFHYYPQIAEAVLNETLLEFNVKYWGIGERHLAKVGNEIFDSVGATLGGKAAIDITSEQRGEIIRQIQHAFNVEAPKLVPLALTDVQVKPYFAENALYLKDMPQDFPSNIQFGTAFNYLIESPQNSQLAFYAGAASDPKLTADPSFAIAIVGNAEFVGDPWKVEVFAELKKIWSYIKEKFSGSVNYGWFKVGQADFQNIMVDMITSKEIFTDFKEGSIETEQYGRQILEMGKDIFNNLDTEGEFFKFEPVPKVDEVSALSIFGWGWSLSINGSYLSMEIKQEITYKNTIIYTGRFKRQLPASMSLGIGCNKDTQQHFEDITNLKERCITQDKIDKFRKRVEDEFAKQEAKKKIAEDAYLSGKLTFEQYRERLDSISGRIATAAFKIGDNGDLLENDPLDFVED